MGSSRDVSETSVKHIFYIQLTNSLSLVWQVTQDFKVNGSGKKFIANKTCSSYAWTAIFPWSYSSVPSKKCNQQLVRKNEINISN